MYQESDEPFEYQEYGKADKQVDYMHPEYYHPSDAQSAYSAQPAEQLNPYDPAYQTVYPADSSENEATISMPYTEEQASPYSVPGSVEVYDSDNQGEQTTAQGDRVEERSGKKKGLARLWAGISAIGAMLLKFKGALFLLKFGTAGFTALFSIAVYSLIYGWRFAVGLVALIFIHEMGHAVVMKMKGIPIGSLVFIPLFGAAVTMRRMPQNVKDEAEVGIAGPLAGAIASGVCLYIAQLNPHAFVIWAALAYFGFFMNLFNLIPIVPLDGGRVLAAVDRRIWILGFVGLLALQIWEWLNGSFSIWLLFIVIMAATQLWSRGSRPLTAAGKAYYDVPVGTRIILGLLYFGLAAVLVLGMSIAHMLIPIANG